MKQLHMPIDHVPAMLAQESDRIAAGGLRFANAMVSLSAAMRDLLLVLSGKNQEPAASTQTDLSVIE